VTEPVLAPDVTSAIERLGPVDVVVAFVDPAPSDALRHAIRAAQVGLAQFLPDRVPAIVTVVDGATGAAPLVVAEESADVVERILFVAPKHIPRRIQVTTSTDTAASSGARLGLRVASALSAEITILIGGDLSFVVPEWIELLSGPILKGRAEVVIPVATRHRFDDVVDAVLVTPLVRALCQARITQAGGATAGMGRPGRDRLIGNAAADLWLSVGMAALAAGLTVAEARVGPASSGRAPHVTDEAHACVSFGTMLSAATTNAEGWRAIRDLRELPRYGFDRGGEPDPVRVDPVAWLSAFEVAASSHRARWSALLGQQSLNAVLGLAVTAAGVALSARDWLNLDRGADIGRLDTTTLANAMATFHVPDDVWARVVVDALLATASGATTAADAADALLPVLLGRAASYVVEARRAGHDEVEALVARQTAAFERLRPHLVSAWPTMKADAPAAEAGARLEPRAPRA
jgi:hypothetical protein